MTRIHLNREQWWLLCATYAAVLFVQRDNLREPNIATGFLIVGALLVAWRLNRGKAVPADVDVRRPIIATIGVIAVLSLGAFMMNNRPSPQDEAATPSAAPPTPQGVTQRSDARTLSPEPDGQAPVFPADLLQEFQANNFVADEKYRGRFIKVVGEVASIEGGPNEVAFVQLRLRPKRQDFMQAMFPRNAAQIRGLKEGDRVILSCSPRYDADIDNVTLNDCSLAF
jgi:hypothetical protein